MESVERKVPSFFSPCPFMFVGGAVGEIGRETGMREKALGKNLHPLEFDINLGAL